MDTDRYTDRHMVPDTANLKVQEKEDMDDVKLTWITITFKS